MINISKEYCLFCEEKLSLYDKQLVCEHCRCLFIYLNKDDLIYTIVLDLELSNNSYLILNFLDTRKTVIVNNYNGNNYNGDVILRCPLIEWNYSSKEKLIEQLLNILTFS